MTNVFLAEFGFLINSFTAGLPSFAQIEQNIHSTKTKYERLSQTF
jgi:hypothetical protein